MSTTKPVATGTVGGTVPAQSPPGSTATVGIGSVLAGSAFPARNQPGPVRGEGGGAVHGAPPTAAPPIGVDASAKAQLMKDLAGMGLDANAQAFSSSPQSLGDWVWQEWLNTGNSDQILLDLRQTQPYKYAYSGMEKLQASGMNISEAEYRAKEDADTGILRLAGLSDGMAKDKALLGNLIGNQVSTAELQARVQDYQTVIQQVGGQTLDYLRSAYGIHAGDLLHFWLDPEQGEAAIHQKVQASQIGAAANMAGLNGLDPTTALHLAGLGVSASQAATGFQKIAGMGDLGHSTDSSVSSVSQQQLIDAELGGNGNAASAVLKAQQERVAKFQSGGGFAGGNAGVSGLGVGPQGF